MQMVAQAHHFDLPGLGKIPWRNAWQSIPAFFPGNPMDRGAGRATIYRVTKSQTRPKRLFTCEKVVHFSPFPCLCCPSSLPLIMSRVSSEQLPLGHAHAQACPVPHSPSGEFSDLCLHHLLCLNLPAGFKRMLFSSMLLLPASPQSCSHKGSSSLMHMPPHRLHLLTAAYAFLLLRMHEFGGGEAQDGGDIHRILTDSP